MKKRLFKHEHVKSKNAKIRRYVLAHPEAKCADVATLFDTSVQAVYSARYTLRKKELLAASKRMHITMIEDKKPDNVNHPAHYKVGGVETIDFIEAKGLNYNLGNVVKYITRAGHKSDLAEDLKKARWYLNREISKLEPNATTSN